MELRTKWDILTEELADLRKQVEERERYLLGLTITRCHADPCGCGHVFDNEADYAKHFVVSKSNEFNRLLNLGECPEDVKANGWPQRGR